MTCNNWSSSNPSCLGITMSATLLSNDGESRFTMTLDAYSEYAHESGFDSSIQFDGRHWDGDHTHPVSAAADVVWLRCADLESLCEHIQRWVSLPLTDLRVERLSGEFELAGLPGQRVWVRFGERSDTIASLNPVVSLVLAAGPFFSEFHFVTDQSCLGSFLNDLITDIAAHKKSVL